MGAPFLPLLHNALDYCRSSLVSSVWYIFGTLVLYYNTSVSQVFSIQDMFLAAVAGVVIVVLTFYFSKQWQSIGRPLMPHTPYSEESTTFYDYTHRYAFVKALEIYFQNVAAAATIVAIYAMTDSVLVTGVVFGGVFFAAHTPSFFFFGKEWIFFITVAAVVAGAFPAVAILLVPGGILYLFSFHNLMYLLFLLSMRRKRLSEGYALP